MTAVMLNIVQTERGVKVVTDPSRDRLLTDFASPGIEPNTANAYVHKTLSGSFIVRNRYLETLLEDICRNNDAVWSSITAREGSVQHLDFLDEDEKAVFKTAFEIDQRWLVDLAADRAPHICQSQSLNLFLRADIHKRDLHQIHMMAWRRGVKSLYYCRSKSLQRADVVAEHGVAIPEEAALSVPLAAATADAGAGRVNAYEDCLACQ